jgi:type IX secretion system PorP/SprF family membrane protein
MNKIYKIIIVVLILQTGFVRGQDMHFTQFFASPLYLNPAFAGADVCSRVSLTYRNQWPGIYKTYKSYMLGIDHCFVRNNIGVGLLMANDIAGSGGLRTTLINPMIAYQAKLNRQFIMRLAIQPGIGMRSINFNDLVFGDAIAHGTTVEQPTQTKTFFDLGAGALFYSAKYWGGFSIYHLNKPDESIMGIEGATLPIKYSLHGGAKFNIEDGENDKDISQSVTAVFNYRGQQKFDQLDIGAYYTKNVVSVGAWYRGIPIKQYKPGPGYANNDAIALIIGVKTKRANIGYSFDITISKLAGLSKGAHEVTMAYQLCKPSKKKKKLVIPCPKF